MFAFSFGGGPPSNQYALTEYGGSPGYSSTSGRTLETPTIDASTGVFIAIGQSLICSVTSGGTAYTPTNAATALNLNPYDGLYYRSADPLLGGSYTSPASSWLGRFQDSLINASKYNKVVVVPVAIGGTYASDWSPSGVHNHRLVVALLRCRKAGITPNAILWMQGQADANAGTSQASYEGSLNGAIATSRGYGFSGKWVISRSTRIAGGVTNSTIRAGQVAVCNGATVIQGPDCDTDLASAGNYGPDDLHFNNTGNANCASLWSTWVQSNL